MDFVSLAAMYSTEKIIQIYHSQNNSKLSKHKNRKPTARSQWKNQSNSVENAKAIKLQLLQLFPNGISMIFCVIIYRQSNISSTQITFPNDGQREWIMKKLEKNPEH